jgi:hypothetical protein
VNNLKKQKVVIKVKNLKNTRGNVSCASYSADAKLVGCGTNLSLSFLRLS